MRMQIVRSLRWCQAAVVPVLVALLLWPGPARAIDLFARHQVSVSFATADGKPLADAEVRVFAPGQPNRPALTGRTDREGRFEFPASDDGFWTAEARSGDEIARATVRVGTPGKKEEPLSEWWLLGGLFVLLILAFTVRIARARSRRRPRA
jgi:hypothetical protein